MEWKTWNDLERIAGFRVGQDVVVWLTEAASIEHDLPRSYCCQYEGYLELGAGKSVRVKFSERSIGEDRTYNVFPVWCIELVLPSGGETVAVPVVRDWAECALPARDKE